MNKDRMTFIGKIIFVFLLCATSSMAFFVQPQGKIKVLTTLFPLYEFAQAVCGERGEVDLLIPPGAEIHSWKPKPSDIVKIAQADLFVVVGQVLEPWLEDILHSVKNPDLYILETSADFKWKEEEELPGEHAHDHEAFDPHIWLDFDYDTQIIEQISAALTRIDPFNADFYNRNAGTIRLKLKSLDNLYKDELGGCLVRTFIMGGHSAFGYIAQKYDLNQVAVYGMSPDSMPSPRKIFEIIRLAKEQKVNAIYFEAMLSDEIAQMIASEVGCQTLALNPGANVSREELQSGVSFFDIMKKNLENLKIGLAADSRKILIDIDDVSFNYGYNPVLNRVSFSIHSGDFLALIGSNGSGKTTLLKIILGLLKPVQGVIRVFGSAAHEFKNFQKIGYVPQKATHIDPLFPVSVKEVIAMGLLSGRQGPGRSKKSESIQLENALTLVGLQDLKNWRNGKLSGGQQQRVFIARAIVNQPEILFLDEPTTGVDTRTHDHFYEMLDNFNKKNGMTIVLVTHEIGIINKHVSQVACLNQSLVYHGTHSEFCRSDAFKEMLSGGHHVVSHRH